MKKAAPNNTDKTIKSFLRICTYAAADDRRKLRENEGRPERTTAVYDFHANILADKTKRLVRKEWIKYNPRQIKILRRLMEDYISDVIAADLTKTMDRGEILTTLEELDEPICAHIIIGSSERLRGGLLSSCHDNQKLSSLLTNKLAKYISAPSLMGNLAEYFLEFLKRLAYTIVVFCWDEARPASVETVFNPILIGLGIPTLLLDSWAE